MPFSYRFPFQGTRKYAAAVAAAIDKSGLYFGKRIVTRTDVPDLYNLKKLDRILLVKNLIYIYPESQSENRSILRHTDFRESSRLHLLWTTGKMYGEGKF